MKKILAILLALALVLVNVAVLAGDVDPDNPPTDDPVVIDPADEPEEDPEEDPASGEVVAPAAETAATPADPSATNGQNAEVDTNKVTITKNFNVTGTGAKTPPQTVSFTVGEGTVTNSTTITTAPVVTIDSVDFDEGDTTKDVTINLPKFEGVGVYTYPITETNTNIAGEKYASSLELKITIIQGTDNLVIGGIALRQADVKTDTLENDYKANALTVGKTVTGNLGDKAKHFPITVVLTAPDDDKVYGSVGVTITGDDDTTVKDGENAITTTIAAEAEGWTTKTLNLMLKDGDTVKFDNLPDQVTYTIVEDAAIEHTGETQTEEQQGNPEAYYVTDEVKTAATLSKDTEETITNNKTIEIDTGIELETLPFVLLMGIALAGVVLSIRRREDY